jgi:hypothetical protein
MRSLSLAAALGMGLLAGFSSLLPALGAAAPPSPIGIYTYHGDNMRTGWNSHETQLSPATVTVGQFGKLWTYPVDGQVYAQPLLAPGVKTGAAGTRNVVFVATEHNSVYAFDADTGGEPLWRVSMGPSVPNSAEGVPCGDIAGPEYGITGSPVIDPAAGTLYVAAKTLEGGAQHYRLHALDITNGQERPGWPVEILGSVAGTGGGSVNGRIAFDPRIENQRAALLLLNGRVILAFGAHCDHSLDRYHGWIFSYNTADPAQLPAIFNTTPDAGTSSESAGGVWQSGFGLAADSGGNVYFETGNGAFDADEGGRNLGDSFVRLTTAGGSLTFTPGPANYYTPNGEMALDQGDLDLGSGGAMVIPDQTGTNTPRLLVGSGKDGIIRVLNRDSLGGHTGRQYAQLSENALQNVSNPGGWPIGAVFGGPAYWEGPKGGFLFYTGTAHPLRRYRLSTNPNGSGASWLAPDAESADRFGTGTGPGYETATPTPVVSSNGKTAGTGIVWLLRREDNTLRAYNADDLSLLWHSQQGAGNNLDGAVVKFTLPIVANGKVYAGTNSSIACYGLKTGR